MREKKHIARQNLYQQAAFSFALIVDGQKCPRSGITKLLVFDCDNIYLQKNSL